MHTFVPCGPRYSFGEPPVSPATGSMVEAISAAKSPSAKTSAPASSSNAAVSGRLSAALGVTPLKPHGYSVMSSEWASTLTVTVRVLAPGLVSSSPKSAARRPSGTKSVRSSRGPAAGGRSSFA
jgi:hypothetical protein